MSDNGDRTHKDAGLGTVSVVIGSVRCKVPAPSILPAPSSDSETLSGPQGFTEHGWEVTELVQS